MLALTVSEYLYLDDRSAYDGFMVSDRVTSASPLAQPNWWHQLEKLLSLHMPELTGKTVLDVGAGDGYFSFAAERFGASRVVAVDTCVWHQRGGKDSFEHTRRTLDSNVEDLELDVLDISPDTVGKFDVVLFLGHLYYARHPMLALEKLATVTSELLLVETVVDIIRLRSPATALHPPEAPHDYGSKCGPNRGTVLDMLHAAGFKRVVAYPLRRLSAAHLVGLPARAKTATELVCTTPMKSRRRLVRDFAKHALTQNHLVTHSWVWPQCAAPHADALNALPLHAAQDPISVLTTAS